MRALEERFGISGDRGLVYQLELIAVELTNDYWKKYYKGIIPEREGSLLERIGKKEFCMKFRLAAVASISYMLFSRCGFAPWKYLKTKDFKDIPAFNTQKIIRILGEVVSRSSEQVLRTIAVTIYNHEQQAKNTTQPAQTHTNDRESQPSTTPAQKPDETQADVAQEDATKEPESAITETVQEDAEKGPEPENSIQNNLEAEPANHKPQHVYYQVGDMVYIKDTLY